MRTMVNSAINATHAAPDARDASETTWSTRQTLIFWIYSSTAMWMLIVGALFMLSGD
ncbi:hypothetical protein [Oceanibacterium hippocampi]|uniref:Uncharacterized protein n=1 Tax=Oceanibacterium hippocampi TaxID=745714 RepID=A0A1Y5TPE1_9PROT|nr:hypothetical protein [Oceanibacterium hippocampi]SLN68882.1 hypothetical protein OCH7691_03138 [Oceanibacterium hippocampi]